MIYFLLQWYIIVPALLALFYWHGTRNFSHWRKLGVKHISPEFFFGNIRKRVLFRQSFHELQKELYFSFPGERVAGIYEGRRPTLMVRDPDLIKLIMVRDFDHFVDRPVLRFRQRPSVNNMLITLQGAQWKAVRAILTPTFTSGKIKSMSLLVMDVGKQMVSFLENVIDKPESMRKHPPVARMDRKCTKEYLIPETNITLKPEASVSIPVMGLHYDSQYYPDPERFDPTRFSAEEKAKRSPYVYLPFGSGPRNCIGARFALTSTKMALVYFLQGFGVEPCLKTEIPYAYSKFSMLLKAEKGIWLNIKRLTHFSDHSSHN
ncbi:Cytochrome P450 CYP6k1-like [Frankliniella occidentalis]|nr:Cytochrome P450 CYP6k1-like [Frankliniella occidentalis]